MNKLIENLKRLRETREKEIFRKRIFKILSILLLLFTVVLFKLPALTLTEKNLNTYNPSSSIENVTDSSQSLLEGTSIPSTTDNSQSDTSIKDGNLQGDASKASNDNTKSTTDPIKEKSPNENNFLKGGKLTSATNYFNVSVDYSEGTFKENVKLVVADINDSKFDNKIKNIIREGKKSLTQSYSVDIAFQNQAGEEIEPLKPVQVTIQTKNILKKTLLQDDWELYHFIENDTSKVEDLTSETSTNMNETSSGQLTSLSFNSDSFSTYTIAGTSIKDFSPYLTAAIASNSIYSSDTKILTTNLDLAFQIPKTDLTVDNKYTILLPQDTSWDTGVQVNTDYKVKDGGVDAYSFKFVSDGTNKYIVVTFDPTYIANSGPTVKGDLYYKATSGVTYRDSSGNYNIPFSNSVNLTISSGTITNTITQPVNDINNEKKGSISYEGDSAYLNYSVTIWSDKGTIDPIVFSDQIQQSGVTFQPLEIVSVVRSDYQYWYTEAGINSQTISVSPKITNSTTSPSFDLNLPKLNAKQKYIITYRYKVSNFSSVNSTNITNTIMTKSGSVTSPQASPVTLTLDRNKVEKTANYDPRTNKITWTVVVNSLNNDINGAILSDSMLKSADSILINGNSSSIGSGYILNKSNGTVSFTSVSNGINTGKYTIVYTTDAGSVPSGWIDQQKTVSNTATFTDNGEVKTASASVKTGTGNPGGIEKTFKGMSPTTKPDIKELSWQVAISMPSTGVIPSGAQFVDNLQGANGTNNAVHYYTWDQLNKINQELTKIFGANNYTLEAQQFDWQYIPYSLATSTQIFQSFKFTLNKDFISASSVTLNYTSTINKADVTTFSNTISSSGHTSTSNYKYEEISKITKMDGSQTAYDGMTNEYVSKDTSNTIEKDGTIIWVVKLILDDTTMKVSLTDTPPDGLMLTGFSYGNGTYNINESSFDIVNNTISWNNPYYFGSFGTTKNISVVGNIDNTGKITVNFNSLNGSSIKSILGGSSTLYAKFVFKPKTIPLDQNLVTTYTNSAEATLDGKSVGSDSQTQTITQKPGNKLSKSGVWDNNNREVNYNLVINPDSQDLAAGQASFIFKDTLTYQEDLSTNLNYELQQDSVQLIDSNGQIVDKNLWSWKVEKTKDASGKYYSIITASIPNFNKYTLKYTYNVYRNVPSTDSSSLTVSNSAEIQGLTTGETSTSTPIYWRQVDAGGTISSDKSFTVTKVDSVNYGIVLPNSVFESRDSITDTSIAEYTTGSDGTFKITSADFGTSLKYATNRMYYIVEKTPPSGYVLPTNLTKYYFYYSTDSVKPIELQNEINQHPNAVNLAVQGKQTYIENEKEPDSTSITINKLWKDSNGENTTRVSSEITVSLHQVAKDSSNATISDIIYGEPIVISNSTNWSQKIENLPLRGTYNNTSVSYYYYVQEEPVQGYETTYSNTANSSSRSEDILSQGDEIIITNKAIKEYVLPETGGIGNWIYYFAGFVTIVISFIGIIKVVYLNKKG